MAYELEDFCDDCRAALNKDDGKDGREEIRKSLEKLLTNQDFVAATCGAGAETGVHTLYRDADLGFMVLAHICDESRTSPPHDHGDSWAIYGQAAKFTDMSKYVRTDDGKADGVASVEKKRTYRLDPGSAGVFGPGDIHSIHFPAGARFIRVTGTDLNEVETHSFDVGENKSVTSVVRAADGGAAGSANV